MLIAKPAQSAVMSLLRQATACDGLRSYLLCYLYSMQSYKFFRNRILRAYCTLLKLSTFASNFKNVSMSQVVINNYKEFESYLGKEIGVSDYITVEQGMINKFADATKDHQWIHIDAKRAETDSPFKKTIAHGYLAVSLVPYLWNQIAKFNNLKMLINYGIERLKFNQPVVVDSEVRLRVKLASLANLRGIAKAELEAELQIKDNPKPAFTATVVLLYHFNA